MANKVNITDTKNNVTITPQSSTNISTSTTNTPITVTQGTTSVVTVNTLGPQGAKGDDGTSPGFDGDIQVRHITASGNISASSDIIATNISASGEIRIDNPLHTGNLRIYQQSDNQYRLVSNIGVALEIGPLNAIKTNQRIEGTRGMFVKTYLGSDTIRFRDYDDNNIIEVGHTGSLKLGNSSAQNPSVTVNTDITASGDISASGDVYAQNIRIPIDAASPGKIIGNDNKSFQLEDGGGFARIDVFRGFKVVTNEGTTSQKARFGLDKVEITNADFSVDGHITASGNISASGDIFADTASFFNIILDHRGTAEPTLTFESDGGPDFTFGFNGDNTLQLSGKTGASGQTFELSSEVENFRMNSGGTVLIQRGNDVGTGSKHDGGLFIESQNTTNSNGKAAQFTALNTGGVLKNTSFGGTGKHGTFKFINGGNLSNAIDSTEHVVAEFGPTSSAHFTFHVPITASGNISASGDIIANEATLKTINNATSISFDIGGIQKSSLSTTNFNYFVTTSYTNTVAMSGDVRLDYANLPTSDPGVSGRIYRSSSNGMDNLLFISAG